MCECPGHMECIFYCKLTGKEEEERERDVASYFGQLEGEVELNFRNIESR